MQQQAIDLLGQKFGRLTVIAREKNNKEKRAMWLCKCDCGNKKIVTGKHLRNGSVKSCGCLLRETTIERNIKHGLCYSPLYKIWRGIKERCYNKNNSSYKNYGDRGIIMCDEWHYNFKTFYDWAMNNGYKEGLSIDRIDVNNNYMPLNCRWATRKEQSRNTRVNLNITYKEKTQCLTQWAEELNVDTSALYSRITRVVYRKKY